MPVAEHVENCSLNVAMQYYFGLNHINAYILFMMFYSGVGSSLPVDCGGAVG